jgi:myo-inositol 2-dehydrogenase/D-chiro-inositol 1-dehydrogenase
MRARVVVVGLGRIGRLHAANLAGRVPSASLAGVVDSVEPMALGVAQRHGVPSSTSLEELLRDVDPDGVVIAAPTALHAELVERTATAGFHVFCEKPLGFDPAAARRAVDAVEAAGVELQVGFQRRFDADWVAARAALCSGELGELALLRGSHRNTREPRASAELGDLFDDLASHDLDGARWLAGEVAELFAWERPGTACISLRFESGALGQIDVSRRAAYGFDCSIELVGSRATARTGHAGGTVELLCEGRASTALPADHAQRHAAAYVAELDAFGELVLGGSARGASGEDAVAALSLALLARRSAATGAPVSADAVVAA